MSKVSRKAHVSTRPRIAVIIPTFNEAHQVARAVQSAVDAGAAEVIVADGGSVDDTRQIAQAAGAIVIRAPKGRAVQQNAGAAIADRPDVLLFLHADNWLDVTCLRQVSQVWDSKRPVIGAFRQRIEAAGFGYRLLEIGNSFRARTMRQPYGDQGIFVSVQLFRDVGSFPTVPLMEELALMRNVRRIARPLLLPGPIHVDARRWKARGILRQTIRNWTLVLRYWGGVSPAKLAGNYPDQSDIDFATAETEEKAW